MPELFKHCPTAHIGALGPHPTRARAVVATGLCQGGSNKPHVSAYNNNPHSSSLTSSLKNNP